MSREELEAIRRIHCDVIQQLNLDILSDIARMIKASIAGGRKVMICGCGGSAADAQHFAAELVGRFQKDRKPLAAIALTTDSSILTAVGNDFGFDEIFSRQISALGRVGDVLLAISTSGRSAVIHEAVLEADRVGCRVASFTGLSGGWLVQNSELTFVVKSTDTARIQEAHELALHMICHLLDLPK